MDPTAVWYGTGLGARTARGLLVPASWAYRAVVAGRNALFDAGMLTSRATALPAVSVGNLSAGGTGKTPIAADLARRLYDAGARPALLLRGYGDDEVAVHAHLNPAVRVLTSPDRVAASAEAAASGCDVVVLDDAFQHRWARRLVDIVLVATEQWQLPLRLLPAGPYREPLSALRRATLVIVTRKSARVDEAERVARAIATVTTVPCVRVAFHLDELRRVGASEDVRAPSTLRGTQILAVAGIGTPRAFARQLEASGARVELQSFPDHRRFTPADAALIARRAHNADSIVCTLKDAVKLERIWSRASPPLWYVSQRIELEDGHSAYSAAIQQLLDARPHVPPTR